MSAGRSSQAGGLLLGGPDEVLDVVEVDAGQVGAPGRHRLAAEELQAPSAAARASTPARSSWPRCRGRRPRSGRGARTRRRRRCRPSRTRSGPSGRAARPGCCGSRVLVMRRSLPVVVVAGLGSRWHVRRWYRVWATCSVGRGCAWCRPRRRGRWWPAAARACRAGGENTAVSASHSCGNSAATCATGQWCWQSCPPVAIVEARGSVALGGQRVGERLGPATVRRSAPAPLDGGSAARPRAGDLLLGDGAGPRRGRRARR